MPWPNLRRGSTLRTDAVRHLQLILIVDREGLAQHGRHQHDLRADDDTEVSDRGKSNGRLDGKGR